MPKKQIISFIDFFYPPFRKIMPVQTFRYAACGGANTFLDIFIYFISYNYILNNVFIKIFVERFHIYPTIAKILTTAIVVLFSYLTQKNYTFKAQPEK